MALDGFLIDTAGVAACEQAFDRSELRVSEWSDGHRPRRQSAFQGREMGLKMARVVGRHALPKAHEQSFADPSVVAIFDRARGGRQAA